MGTFWRSITNNYIINVGVISWFSAQLIKTILTWLQYRELRMERMFGAGGMPSSHSALVCSMTLAMAKLVGFDSPLFGCDNFIVTPHLGAQTVDASRDIGAHIINKVKEALDLK